LIIGQVHGDGCLILD